MAALWEPPPPLPPRKGDIDMTDNALEGGRGVSRIIISIHIVLI